MIALKNTVMIFLCAFVIMGSYANASMLCCSKASYKNTSVKVTDNDMPCHESKQDNNHKKQSCECKFCFKTLSLTTSEQFQQSNFPILKKHSNDSYNSQITAFILQPPKA